MNYDNCYFCHIKIGDTFIYNNKLYRKIDSRSAIEDLLISQKYSFQAFEEVVTLEPTEQAMPVEI